MLHRSWKGTIAAGVLAALVSVVARPAAADRADPEDWQTLSRGPVTVLFLNADRTAGARVLEIAAPAAVRLSAELGTAAPSGLRLIVAPTDADFTWLGGGRVPDWGIGWADPERALVVLKSPRIVAYPLQMEDVVVHELAHVVVGRALGTVQVPRWFDEGIAMTLAGEWEGEETALGAAAITRTLYPLGDLETDFPAGARGAALAYAESREAVEFLMREGGVRTGAELVHAVAAGPDFAASVLRISGRTLGEFDADFRAHVRRRYGWGVVLQGTGAAMLLATLVFGLAAARRTLRTRRRMRELEAEERRPQPIRRPRARSSWM